MAILANLLHNNGFIGFIAKVGTVVAEVFSISDDWKREHPENASPIHNNGYIG